MKRILLLLFPMVIMLTGCQAAVQVSDREFVRMMGIERDGEDIVLTLQVYSTEDSDISSAVAPEFEVLSGRGDTVDDAVDDIRRSGGKSVFFGSCQLIAVDGKILGNSELLGSFVQRRISSGCNVVYSEKPSLFVAANDDSGELITAESRISAFEYYKSQGRIIPITLLEAISAAKYGDVLVIPEADVSVQALKGSAVAENGIIRFLDEEETAILNALQGAKNFSVKGDSDTASLKIPTMKYDYNVTAQDESIICEVTLDYSVEDKYIGETVSDYSGETLNTAVENFLYRAAELDLLNMVIDSPIITENPQMPVTFRVTRR
ncbi:MAG: hypothetical protein LIO69_05700 [Oscillospiraceae bacterium]|nr:hypothetical protein [Oscillospiraceae bacterium]